MPGAYFGTDIMVGFPGETAADFDRTRGVFTGHPFALCHVFTFSEREGTPAAMAADHVPVPERNRRSAVLRKLAHDRRHDFYARHLGQTLPVLLEDPKPGAWPGYTDNYIRVMIDAAKVPGPDADLRNRLARVRLDRVAADFVEGSLVEMID